MGTLIIQDGRSHSEVISRIKQAKIVFQKMRTLLTNTNILVARQRGLQCYEKSILMFEREAWTTNKPIQKKIETVEMWFWMRMLRIPWTTKKETNIEIMEEAGQIGHWSIELKKDNGYIMRKEGLEPYHYGKSGKKTRQGETERIDAAQMDIEKTTSEISPTKDRGGWKDIIPNAINLAHDDDNYRTVP